MNNVNPPLGDPHHWVEPATITTRADYLSAILDEVGAPPAMKTYIIHRLLGLVSSAALQFSDMGNLGIGWHDEDTPTISLRQLKDRLRSARARWEQEAEEKLVA